MMDMWILDDEDRPLKTDDVVTWVRFMEDRRPVGWTQITSECLVSTVFLGIDHRFSSIFGAGPPILFETMIFGGPDSIDQAQWRYSSWDDADAGHKAAVRKARAALGQKVTS